jgi:hypothetical protein
LRLAHIMAPPLIVCKALALAATRARSVSGRPSEATPSCSFKTVLQRVPSGVSPEEVGIATLMSSGLQSMATAIICVAAATIHLILAPWL